MATEPRRRPAEEPCDASEFIERLIRLASTEQRAKYRRYFKGDGARDFVGVPMGAVFSLARQCLAIPIEEVDKLLLHPVHEIRAGALKVMALQAADRRSDDARRKELFDLYLRRRDRIDSWDLVDLCAWDVVGRYLYDKPRDLLCTLARSSSRWERRTAILSTLFFVRRGDLHDALDIAEILAGDPEELVQKAVGGVLREVGRADRARLVAFLDRHAADMPRAALRYATEHLAPDARRAYLELANRRSASTRRDRPPRKRSTFPHKV